MFQQLTLLAGLSLGQLGAPTPAAGAGATVETRVRLQAAVVVASSQGAPGSVAGVLRPLERRLRSLLPYSTYKGFTEYTAALAVGEGIDLRLPDGRQVRLTPEPTAAERQALTFGRTAGSGRGEPLRTAQPASPGQTVGLTPDGPEAQPRSAPSPDSAPSARPRRARATRRIHVAVERGEEFDSRVVCDNALVFQVHNGTADRPGERTFLVFTVACPGEQPLRLLPDPR